MAEYIKKIELDFNAEYPTQTIFAKQLDESSRYLLAEPQLDGNKFDVRDCTVKLYAKRNDDTVIIVNGTVTDDGDISFELTDLIKSPETLKCDVKLIYENKVLSSCLFYIKVIQTIMLSNKIRLIQNTAYSDIIQVKNGEAYYQLSNAEKLIFTVKNGSEIILQKELTNSEYIGDENGYLLALSSAETDIDAGVYYYNVTLLREDNEREPIITKTEFIVEEG